MQTATITSLVPDGRPPYNSANGLLYGFNIAFDDNRNGLVNSKSEVPPYRVGELVGYEVTGKVGNKDKLKITRNPQPQFGQPAAPQQAERFTRAPGHATPSATNAYPPLESSAAVEPIKPVFGATVGQSLNLAGEWLTKGMDSSELAKVVETDDFYNRLWKVASRIITVSRHLEAGNLSKRLESPRIAPPARPAAPVPSHPDLEAVEDSSVPF